MKRFLSTCATSFLILVYVLFFPLTTFANTYGSGNYGDGAYGDSSNTSSSAVTSIGNAIAAFFCPNQAPSSAPNLYEIDITSTTAKLFFAPAGGPYDSHYISYGLGNNNEGYGVNFSTSQTPGALFFTVQQLTPNSVYTFKVRGGNGCKPGPWSNNLTIETRSGSSNNSKKYYPNAQAKYGRAPSANWLTQAGNYISSLLPQAPNTGFAPAKPHVLGISTKSNNTVSHNSQPSLWSSISHFFSSFFRGI